MIYQPGLSIVSQLIDRAASVTQYSRTDIISVRREAPLCHVRFAIMKLAKERGVSLPRIGRALGDRDHTTVISGVRRAKQLSNDPDFARLIADLDR